MIQTITILISNHKTFDSNHVNKIVEDVVKIDFVKPFENRGLLKFLGMRNKFNMSFVRGFFYKF